MISGGASGVSSGSMGEGLVCACTADVVQVSMATRIVWKEGDEDGAENLTDTALHHACSPWKTPSPDGA